VQCRHANLWEATAVAAPDTPAAGGDLKADVLVIGAGYLGLSAALHLAERGVDVIAVDRHSPGFGASGRNGGQVIPGLKYDPDEIEALFGPDNGERLWRFAGATADVVFDLIERHGLSVQSRRTAWVQPVDTTVAASRAQLRAEQWARRGAAVDFWGRDQVAAVSGAARYLGAFVDRRAGTLQPLSYARELARAGLRAKARIYGDTEISSLARSAKGWLARTLRGATITADTVLVCTNAYSDDRLIKGLGRSIVAANSLQIATEPLPSEHRRRILAGGEIASDTRRIIRYWRMSEDGRLLMGGRGPYREPGPESNWAHLRRDVAELFPFLDQVSFTHRWGGRVAIHPNYLPHLHSPSPGVLVAIGCQGRGIGWQTSMGRELSGLVTEPGREPLFPFTPIAPIPLHRIRALSVSATIAAYRALDRLGIN
jgi:glycine/D-amino acid oxidase-like deaminating enzyme